MIVVYIYNILYINAKIKEKEIHDIRSFLLGYVYFFFFLIFYFILKYNIHVFSGGVLIIIYYFIKSTGIHF